MELDEAITVAKINTQIGPSYLVIGWQSNSFEMYLYQDDKIWKGKFSSDRLTGFSKNLQLTESSYFASVRHCLSLQRSNYIYELKSGFFYWKRRLNNSIIIEGFLPVDLEKTSKASQPDLFEVLLALNNHLIGKVNFLKCKLDNMKLDYRKCLKDTEEFLNLKTSMDKALSKKFLNLLNIKKSEVVNSKTKPLGSSINNAPEC